MLRSSYLNVPIVDGGSNPPLSTPQTSVAQHAPIPVVTMLNTVRPVDVWQPQSGMIFPDGLVHRVQ